MITAANSCDPGRRGCPRRWLVAIKRPHGAHLLGESLLDGALGGVAADDRRRVEQGAGRARQADAVTSAAGDVDGIDPTRSVEDDAVEPDLHAVRGQDVHPRVGHAPQVEELSGGGGRDGDLRVEQTGGGLGLQRGPGVSRRPVDPGVEPFEATRADEPVDRTRAEAGGDERCSRHDAVVALETSVERGVRGARHELPSWSVGRSEGR